MTFSFNISISPARSSISFKGISPKEVFLGNWALDPCETVSSTMVSEIIAPIVTYGITKTVENVFEKNYFSFSSPVSNVDSYYCSNIKQDNNTMG